MMPIYIHLFFSHSREVYFIKTIGLISCIGLSSRRRSLFLTAATRPRVFSPPRPGGLSVAPRTVHSKRRYIYIVYIYMYVYTRSCPRREPEAVPCQEEAWRRERDLPWRGCGPRTSALGDPILHQSTLVLLGVTVRALSSRRAEQRSRLLRHALPSLPYLRCNLFPGINAA